MVALDRGMPPAAIRIDNDRISPIERRRLLRPAISVDDAVDPRDFVEAAFKQQTSGAKLMFARAVAGAAGNQNNFLLRGDQLSHTQYGQGNEMDQFRHKSLNRTPKGVIIRYNRLFHASN